MSRCISSIFLFCVLTANAETKSDPVRQAIDAREKAVATVQADREQEFSRSTDKLLGEIRRARGKLLEADELDEAHQITELAVQIKHRASLRLKYPFLHAVEWEYDNGQIDITAEAIDHLEKWKGIDVDRMQVNETGRKKQLRLRLRQGGMSPLPEQWNEFATKSIKECLASYLRSLDSQEEKVLTDLKKIDAEYANALRLARDQALKANDLDEAESILRHLKHPPSQSFALEVVAASYGEGSRKVDVRPRISELLKASKEIQVDLNNLKCGDPARGVRKFLDVKFKIGTQELDVRVREGMSLLIESKS